MALIRCNVCGGMVSDKAARCPKCGNSISKIQQQDTITPESKNCFQENNNEELDSFNDEYIFPLIYLFVIASICCLIWFSISS